MMLDFEEDRKKLQSEMVQIVEVEKIVKVFVGRPDGEAPEPKFKAGQPVHHWWATWMAGAAVAPPGVGDK